MQSHGRQVQQLADLVVFAKVVEQASFSGAARALGLAKSAVSKQVQRLEAGLGAKLLHRTTRQLSLTEAGHVLYEHAALAAQTGDVVQDALGRLTTQPAGVLRMTASATYATHVLAPLVPEFHQRYPEIHLALTLMDRQADLTEDGLDLAIRLTPEPTPSLAGRPLHRCEFVLCASPAYLRHTPIRRLQRAGFSDEVLAVGGCVSVNSSDVVRALVLQGLGVGLLPRFAVAQDIQDRRLRQVLPQWQAQAAFGPMAWALWQPHRAMPQKVRVMVDFLVEKLGPVAA